MSIVSETLKKLEKKREVNKEPVSDNKNAGARAKTFIVLLFIFLGIAILIAGLLYFLNVNTLKRQLGPDFGKTPVGKTVKQPSVYPPAEEADEEAPEDREEPVKEIDTEKTLNESEKSMAEEVDISPDMKLGGIMTGQGEPYAIINGKIIRIGEKIDGAKIISIEDNSVTYLFNEKEYIIGIH